MILHSLYAFRLDRFPNVVEYYVSEGLYYEELNWGLVLVTYLIVDANGRTILGYERHEEKVKVRLRNCFSSHQKFRQYQFN